MRVIGIHPAADGARVLALGMFDGVHRGHRTLLETGVRCARERGVPLRACTFDRHPLAVVRPERAPAMLTSIPEKARLMSRIGVDEMQLLPFRRELAEMEPEDFLAMLRKNAGLCAVAAGWNYTFGRGARGDAELLERDGRRHGYDVFILPPVQTEEGRPLSSSLIREALSRGDLRDAEAMLGHPWQLTGRIHGEVHTEGRRQISLRIRPGRQLIAPGRYPCRAETDGESFRTVMHMLPSGPDGPGVALLDPPDGFAADGNRAVRMTVSAWQEWSENRLSVALS